MSSWYMKPNSEADIVTSTRIRLARNIKGIPFPSGMTDEQKKELKEKIKAVITESNTPFSKKLKYIDMANVPEIEIKAMVERHTISPEFVINPQGKAIILSEDESISIMIGEEDHIRIQVILGGLCLEEAYDIASNIDDMLHSALHFAFDSNLGYLTECPTNLGTGLRASLMLHLPALEGSGEIRSLSDTVNKIGFTVRGIYGEGSKSLASLYQVSNQVTLGLSEKNAIENLKIIATQLIEKEKALRESFEKLKLEDTVYRALGTLKYSRVLSSNEMMNLISRIKLGISMGILSTDILPMKLFVENQPYMLMKKHGEISPQERDSYRASDIREAFN
ncbi:MAG: protein arginine kinase [Clostridia bacterium]|nr:protein arginine kinase [Clostridia bacterium]